MFALRLSLLHEVTLLFFYPKGHEQWLMFVEDRVFQNDNTSNLCLFRILAHDARVDIFEENECIDLGGLKNRDST